MGRLANTTLLNQTYDIIAQSNGISVSEVARRAKTYYTTIVQRMATMEALGMLLYEDEHGIVYAANKRTDYRIEYSPHTWG